MNQRMTSRFRAKLRQDSFRDALFWWFFAVYAGFCILWLTLAAASAFLTDLVPRTITMSGSGPGNSQPEELILSSGTLALGLFIAWLDPDTPTARPFAVGLVGTAIAFSLSAHRLLVGVWPGAMESSLTLVWVLHILFHLIAGAAYTYALLLFPDGRPPPVSPLTGLLLWSALLVTMLLLIVQGGEPAHFMLYCGIAVVFAGLFSQWHKSRYLKDEAHRAQATTFRNSFMVAIVITVVLGLVQSGFDLHEYLGVPTGLGESPALSRWVLTVLPPLLAATAIVVLITILQYEMWGLGAIEHTPGFARFLTAVVMALYILIEALVHEWGANVGFPLLVIIGGWFLLSEEPLEKVMRWCRRLAPRPAASAASLIEDFSTKLEELPSGDQALVVDLAMQAALAVRARTDPVSVRLEDGPSLAGGQSLPHSLAPSQRGTDVSSGDEQQ